MEPDPFETLTVLGARQPADAALYFRHIGDTEIAAILDAAMPAENTRDAQLLSRVRWPFNDRPWQYTAHAFGYIPPINDSIAIPIKFAGAIQPEEALRDSSIKVTLDRLRVASYPGSGAHRILFDFSARNQSARKKEENLHFNATFKVLEGQEAAIIGYPLFVGLNVGDNGIALRCYTVNVRNDDDERFLAFLESDVFRSGLKLTRALQPAIAPLSEMAVGITKAIAKRNRNVPVQDFYMGLDFGNVATGARLAQGSYVAVQIPDRLARVWDWNEWQYNRDTGQITSVRDERSLIPLNYIVFGVSRYRERP
jgi:hypothetical protein